ncbi:dihydrolipoamide dehydrogenase [Strigomonas culicis]|uniref:Dihydrolipoamide dehydrogenase n=1 Tax=Strigomonas culicis TaxID=28005 RepID=S9VC69_9TRYP|nr:dihydrolipoamide dehydrogenase [Strigomonas culicis]EPY20610.1 dihydrolipoamide dehydrogenase [Strigomonas culicis]|eukprot:EPY19704.1 dihydrolipoamide dehydrogenase [Strigomonas culicis]
MFRRSFFLSFNTWRAVAEKTHYDVCIIGGGPAGITAALRAVDYKKKVCLIEQKRLGGYDLWDGSLYSQTMWEFSNLYSKLKGSQAKRIYGETLDTYVELDEEKMRESIREVSLTREAQITTAIQATNSIDLLNGLGTFSSDSEVLFHNHVTKEYRRITADYFIIATGSGPRKHPFVEADGTLVMTSNEIMHTAIPKSLVIVGAGTIGCEFASIFGALGKTKVYLIDKSDHILRDEDPDVVQRVQDALERAGVVVHHNSFLYDLQPWRATEEEMRKLPERSQGRREGVQYTILNRRTRELETLHVDRALLCLGRAANYKGLGLENTTLRTKDGSLLVDAFGRCENSNNTYAVGDAADDMHVVSMAQAKGKIAIDNIYGKGVRTVPHLLESMSSVAFLIKAVAAVGLNEATCRQRNIGYVAASFGYDLVSRAVAADNTDGFIKIIVSDDPKMTILGVRAIGMDASTLVDLGSLAIQNRQTAFDLADRLTAYPSISQAFQECLRVILGRSELKANCFQSLKLTRWEPDNFRRGMCYQTAERQVHPAPQVDHEMMADNASGWKYDDAMRVVQGDHTGHAEAQARLDKLGEEAAAERQRQMLAEERDRAAAAQARAAVAAASAAEAQLEKEAQSAAEKVAAAKRDEEEQAAAAVAAAKLQQEEEDRLAAQMEIMRKAKLKKEMEGEGTATDSPQLRKPTSSTDIRPGMFFRG